MQFQSPLQSGLLIKRYKRFLADVELPSGEVITIHCPNTGAMTGCAEPGSLVYFSQSDNPKRKIPWTWEISLNDQGHWIGINTHNANKLVEEALTAATLPAFARYPNVKREVKYGQENSKIDFLLSNEGTHKCFVEVKSVTLLQDGRGYFPDAVTERGQKHLRELADIAENGDRAALLFCVQHTGIETVSVADHIDPVYAEHLQQAVTKGVEVMAWRCSIDQQKIRLSEEIPFIFSA